MISQEIHLLRQKALSNYQSGDILGAKNVSQQILNFCPTDSETLYLMGVIINGEGKVEESIFWINKALEIAPHNAVFWNAKGEAELALGKFSEAILSIEKSIKSDPTYARAFNNFGRLQVQLKNYKAASLNFENALRLNPKYIIAFNNLGAVLQFLELHEEAINEFQKAIQLKPDYSEAHFNLANTLQHLGHHLRAIQHYQEAIRFNLNYAKAYFQMGIALEFLRRDYDALACYRQAVKIMPDNADMLTKLGDHLLVKKDWAEALFVLEKAVNIAPDKSEPFVRLCYAKQLVCDWTSYYKDCEDLWVKAEKALDYNEALAICPWHAITLPWSIERLHLVAKGHSNKVGDKKQDKPFHNFSPTSGLSNTRIKVAYLSGDFNDHPISHLLHGLFGKHNRDKVEVFIYSFTPHDNSSYRFRIQNESEHFFDVSGVSIKEIAKQISSDGIQILIDIMGYTGFNRSEVYPLRPAPIQVNFLGMLGTMGADFFDYIITDEFLTPPDYADNFNEKFVYMPHSYMIAELEKDVSFKKVDRAIYGLPDNGFVFCSFNNSYKIEPISFDLWMEILKQVPQSVLWLQSTGPIMEKNIRAEAEKRGVNGLRIHFAGFVPREDHLHRHLTADLFLDSLVYNAAATSSLALQMGLPVLTCSGKTFASRVCGSLLRAVELPELIAKDYDEFITLAVSLANNPDKLQSYRQNLIKNRSRLPLFDTARFAGYLEKAYAMMWANYKKGNSPAVIKVEE